jgi:hypothetical protein
MCILGTEEEEGEKEKAVLLPMDQVACLLVCLVCLSGRAFHPKEEKELNI